VELQNYSDFSYGGFHYAGVYSVYGGHNQGSVLVPVGGGYNWWVGDVNCGDMGIFAVDGGEEEKIIWDCGFTI
jgi:hypothetical protein